jgi:hypothetical protein
MATINSRHEDRLILDLRDYLLGKYLGDIEKLHPLTKSSALAHYEKIAAIAVSKLLKNKGRVTVKVLSEIRKRLRSDIYLFDLNWQPPQRQFSLLNLINSWVVDNQVRITLLCNQVSFKPGSNRGCDV